MENVEFLLNRAIVFTKSL